LAFENFDRQRRQRSLMLWRGNVQAFASESISDQRICAASFNRAPTGRTWVTRQGVHVDRIASTWLIRRFIDEKAAFKFVPAKGYIQAGELRFDMFDAEFTHIGDRCTFEVLILAADLNDPALQAIAEIFV
jgi:hypothetical protein